MPANFPHATTLGPASHITDIRKCPRCRNDGDGERPEAVKRAGRSHGCIDFKI